MCPEAMKTRGLFMSFDANASLCLHCLFRLIRVERSIFFTGRCSIGINGSGVSRKVLSLEEKGVKFGVTVQ